MKLSFKHFSYLLVAGTLTLGACNNGSDSTTTTDSSASSTNKDTAGSASASTATADTSNKGGATASVNTDQDCVNTLVAKNETEMDWLMAGVNNGGKEVKEHSKMMLADHKALGAKVKAYITKKGLTTPTVDTTGAVSNLAPKGKEWDKAFIDKMVADHTELLDKLKTYEGSVQDADLKAIVTGAEPVVKKHLDMAKAAQGKM